MYVPVLGTHLHHNSLYGLLDAMGRFNLCSAWEIGRLVDGWATSELEKSLRPSIANLSAFSAWARHVKPSALAIQHQTFRVILAVAQRDASEVGAAWMSPWLRWCPRCAQEGVHLIAHQHKAARACPTHGIPLLAQCAYCCATSPYKVKRGSHLFQCTQCGADAAEMAMSLKVSDQYERAWPAAENPEPLALKAESTHIPGFPHVGHETSRTPHLAGSDLKILFAERMLTLQLRSPASNILARYFRFRNAPAPPIAAPVDLDSYHQALLQLLREVRTLASISGHACVDDLSPSSENDHRACPCGVGVRLWRRRTCLESVLAFAGKVGAIPPYAYEASHLALCLSAAWYASAQADYGQDRGLYQSLLQPLNPQLTALERNADAAANEHGGEVALLSHRFQWFAVHCKHIEERIRHRRETTRHTSRGNTGSILEDAAWLAS